MTSRRFPAPWRADKIGARLFVVAEWNHPTVCAARILEYVASPAYREPVSLLHGTKTVNPELIRTSLRKRPWAPEVGMGCDDEDTAMLFMALGKAVGAIWSNLPKDVQHQLFEKAVSAQDDATRERLAIFLHERHFRTTDGIKARAMPEPDSLGG